MGRRQRRAAALGVCGAAVLGSACGSTPSSTPAAPRTTATSSPTTTATSSPTTCRPSELAASRLSTAAAAGHVVVTYGLQNTSRGACTLFGYPGVQLIDASGQALPTQVSRGSYTFAAETPAPVPLAPGAEASFFLGYSDVPSGGQMSCAASARIDITPPGATSVVTLDDRIAPCGNGAVTVSPVHAGTRPPP